MRAEQGSPPTLVLWTSLRRLNGVVLPEQGVGILQGFWWEIGPCEEIQQALVFSSLVQQEETLLFSVLPCSNQVLSVTQSGSQDPWASGLSGPKPVPQLVFVNPHKL